MHDHHAPQIIGKTLGRHPQREVGLKLADRLLHVYAIGQTGTGKSTLLFNLIRQDIAAGRGLCVIDPHGDLAEKVAEVGGAECIIWNAHDPACPYGYNPLRRVAAAYRPLVASGIIETLRKQWSTAWGARMEHLLRFALLALLEQPEARLDQVMPLFFDKEFRETVIATLDDPQVRHFWEVEYVALRYQSSADGVASIANKMGAFLSHPVVRQALCEPTTPIRFREIMDEGKVLVVNLAKGRLGADVANTLGGMIVSHIALAAHSRQELPEAQRRPFFLYIDEFHSFTTAAFADMLAETRKMALGVVLVSQHLSQTEDAVREAILGNVGTIVAFRVGATDAVILAKQFGNDVPRPRDLVHLPNHEMYVRLMIEGEPSRVFSAKSLPL